MEIQYSPIVDADLDLAFLAESCRSTAAACAAENPLQREAAERRKEQADKAARRLFAMRYPKSGERDVLELLDEMIASESYRAEELFPLFSKEARRDGAEQIAVYFEQEGRLAGERRECLERLRRGITGNQAAVQAETPLL